jgi:hypothetical protein
LNIFYRFNYAGYSKFPFRFRRPSIPRSDLIQMGKLTDQLEALIPSDPIIREFISEIESLPGLGDWQMSEPVAGRVANCNPMGPCPLDD